MNPIIKKRGRKAKCPHCGSTRTICKGVRRTTTLGDRPLRICKECRRKFTVRRRATRHDGSGSIGST